MRTEGAGKMRLVGKPADQGDLAQWLRRIQHQRLGTFDPLLKDEAVRRASDAGFESASKMTRAQLGDRGKILGRHSLGEVFGDIFENQSQLPGCKATQSEFARTRFVDGDDGPQHRGDTIETTMRSFGIVIHCMTRGDQEINQGLARSGTELGGFGELGSGHQGSPLISTTQPDQKLPSLLL
jgi:hypothetical protein